MLVDHHDLHHEFPEHGPLIHELKLSNQHFARLFGEYHKTTAEVEALEVRDVPVGDVAIEDMKKKRAKLKDELYTMLVAYKPA